jgi:hypothetical protein
VSQPDEPPIIDVEQFLDQDTQETQASFTESQEAAVKLDTVSISV